MDISLRPFVSVDQPLGRIREGELVENHEKDSES